MSRMLVQKAYQVHSSVVCTIPVMLRRHLEVYAGDYVVFEIEEGTGRVTLTKFTGEGIKNGRSKGHSDREDSGGEVLRTGEGA